MPTQLISAIPAGRASDDRIAVDAGGNVFVTDIGDHTVRKITAGGSVSTVAGVAGVPGNADGVGTEIVHEESPDQLSHHGRRPVLVR